MYNPISSLISAGSHITGPQPSVLIDREASTLGIFSGTYSSLANSKYHHTWGLGSSTGPIASIAKGIVDNILAGVGVGSTAPTTETQSLCPPDKGNVGDGNVGVGNVGVGNVGDGNVGSIGADDDDDDDGNVGDGNVGDGNVGDGNVGDGNVGIGSA